MSRTQVGRRITRLEGIQRDAAPQPCPVIPEGWHTVGRWLACPPVMTPEQWEATVPAEQATLLMDPIGATS